MKKFFITWEIKKTNIMILKNFLNRFKKIMAKNFNHKSKIFFLIISLFLCGCFTSENKAKSITDLDPFEENNRKVHNFNKNIDTFILKPSSQVYGSTIPQFIRLSLSNFQNNIEEPKRMVNHLIQGEFLLASKDLGRFVLNTSFGILGVFDLASYINLFSEDTEFDETFGYYNFPTGAYLEIPLLGPSSIRGFIGFLADNTFNPLSFISGPAQGISLVTFQGLDIVNKRYEYSSIIESILYNSSDSYSSSRLGYLSSRIKRNKNENIMVKELFDPLEDF